MRRVLITAIALTLSATALALGPGAKVVEKETGRSFEAVVAGADAGRTLVCTGAGCRKKSAFGVKVYALAHWIDAAAAASKLDAWKGRSPSQLARDQTFYDALCAVDVEKRLRLEFVHKASGKQVSEGFEASLELTYDTLPPAARKFLDITKLKMAVGDSLELRWLPGGTIEVHHKDKRVGAIEKDPTFAAATWKMWMGKKLDDKHLERMKPELISNVTAVWRAQSG